VLALAQNEGNEKVLKRDAGGIRIILSEKPSGFPPFGVTPRFCVRGDFEITASYELLKLERPASGYGAALGVSERSASLTKNTLLA
jgi:hypothetical protein